MSTRADSKPCDAEEYYPLTISQASLEATRIITPNKSLVDEMDGINLTLTVSENFKPELMNQAYNECRRLNDTLRLYFFKKGLKTFQKILPYEPVKLELTEVESWDAYQKEADAMQKLILLRNNTNPMTARLYQVNDERHGGAIIVKLHHFMIDGYGMFLLLRDLKTIYLDLENNREISVKHRESITNYFRLQKDYLKSEKFKDDRAFWFKTHLHQRDYKAIAPWTPFNKAAKVEYVVDGERYRKLQELQAELGSSMEFIMSYVVAFTIYALTNKTNFAYMFLSHGRRNFKLKNTIGDMYETVPMFFDINVENTLVEQLKASYDFYLSSLSHGNFPALKHIPLSYKEAVRNGFNFSHYNWLGFSSMSGNAGIGDDRFSFASTMSETIMYLFYIAMLEDAPNARIVFSVKYASNRFTQEQIQKMLLVAEHILGVLADDRTAKIKTLIQG